MQVSGGRCGGFHREAGETVWREAAEGFHDERRRGQSDERRGRHDPQEEAARELRRVLVLAVRLVRVVTVILTAYHAVSVAIAVGFFVRAVVPVAAVHEVVGPVFAVVAGISDETAQND